MMPSGKGYTIVYNGVSSVDIPEFICHAVSRTLVGERRHSIDPIPGMAGGWFFGEMPGMKTITIEASVLADSWPIARRAGVRSVADWLDTTSLAALSISDEPGVYNWAALTGTPEVTEWRDRAEFTLEFSAHPFTNSSDLSTHTQVVENEEDTDRIFDLVNAGTVYTEPVFEITAGVGGITDFGMSINGRVLSYTDPISEGDTVTLNCISKTVTTGPSPDTELTGLFEPNNLAMTNVAGLFPYLLGGTNTVTTHAVGAGGYTVDCTWRSRFR